MTIVSRKFHQVHLVATMFPRIYLMLQARPGHIGNNESEERVGVEETRNKELDKGRKELWPTGARFHWVSGVISWHVTGSAARDGAGSKIQDTR